MTIDGLGRDPALRDRDGDQADPDRVAARPDLGALDSAFPSTAIEGEPPSAPWPARTTAWPTAGITAEAGISNVDPSTGTGRGLPLASGSPSAMRTHSIPIALPSLATIRSGAARISILIPSSIASSISRAAAGISARVLR